MADIKYTLTFFSDWHCGSGLSAGPDNDNLVKKNKDDLPFVPGKTIKGLLKEAAADLYEGEDYEKFIGECFGKKSEFVMGEPNYTFFYGNAEFSEMITKHFKDQPDDKQKLFRNIPSTSIDEISGVAKEKSLRSMEVTIPVVLTGKISNIPDGYSDKMEDCLKMVKRLGENRNRGLGRCRFEIIEIQKGDDAQ